MSKEPDEQSSHVSPSVSLQTKLSNGAESSSSSTPSLSSSASTTSHSASPSLSAQAPTATDSGPYVVASWKSPTVTTTLEAEISPPPLNSSNDRDTKVPSPAGKVAPVNENANTVPEVALNDKPSANGPSSTPVSVTPPTVN